MLYTERCLDPRQLTSGIACLDEEGCGTTAFARWVTQAGLVIRVMGASTIALQTICNACMDLTFQAKAC